MKTCVKCEKEFPNSYFYIRPDNNVQYTHCKNCIGEYIKEWRFNNSDKTNKSRAMLKKKRRDENLCRYCGSPRLENSSFCEIDWYKIKAYKNSGTAGNWKFLRDKLCFILLTVHVVHWTLFGSCFNEGSLDIGIT